MTDIAVSVESPPRGRVISGRFVLSEIAGSMGDLGTFVPITVAMVQIVGLDAGTVLVFAGLMSILAGVRFRVPIAVQPMKAIAALAIAGGLSAGQVGVAGFSAGLVVLLMGALGLVSWLGRVVPRAVLRGLQMAVAAQLLFAGVRFGLYVSGTSAFRPLWGPDGLAVAAVALALALLLHRRLPYLALGLVVLGFFGAWLKQPGLLQTTGMSLWQPKWVLTGSSALSGMWLGGLPQIPLTVLNSVLAVSLLSANLFPERRHRTTPKKMAISVGVMNVLTCPFGGMPLCHGSGGLAGQHRFGARSGLSMVMMGSAKLTVGLLFGAAALVWMKAFPSSILAVFLLIAGAGLASVSRCWVTRRGLLTACVVVVVHMASGILLLGFAAGWIVYVLLPGQDSGAAPAPLSPGSRRPGSLPPGGMPGRCSSGDTFPAPRRSGWSRR